MKKQITIITITMIFLTSLVSAIGVTYPHPQGIELKPGQSSYFTFQIQSNDFPLVCVPVIQDNAGLELAFNPEYEVGINQALNIKPHYKATFCVECTPAIEAEGSRIIPKICGLPITANVVAERTRENMLEPESYFGLWITFLIIAIVILALAILYLVRKKQRTLKNIK
jgi:hypothetical protein